MRALLCSVVGASSLLAPSGTHLRVKRSGGPQTRVGRFLTHIQDRVTALGTTDGGLRPVVTFKSGQPRFWHPNQPELKEKEFPEKKSSFLEEGAAHRHHHHHHASDRRKRHVHPEDERHPVWENVYPNDDLRRELHAAELPERAFHPEVEKHGELYERNREQELEQEGRQRMRLESWLDNDIRRKKTWERKERLHMEGEREHPAAPPDDQPPPEPYSVVESHENFEAALRRTENFDHAMDHEANELYEERTGVHRDDLPMSAFTTIPPMELEKLEKEWTVNEEKEEKAERAWEAKHRR